MPSADYFLSKLPAGHATTSLTKPAATALLRADILVLPSFAFNGSAPEMRELCAAALWVPSPNYSATAVKQLPASARNTLCRLMGIPLQPNGTSVQSSRVTHTINSRLNNSAATSQSAAASASAAPAAATGGTSMAAPAAQAAPPPPAHPAVGGAAAAISGGGGGLQIAAGGAASQHFAVGGGVQQAPRSSAVCISPAACGWPCSWLGRWLGGSSIGTLKRV
jgi:hypothetical protein